jgi:chromosomal replication initiation ATPase DnaA
MHLSIVNKRLDPFVFIGDEEFVDEVQEKAEGPGDEHVREDGQILKPSMDKIIRCVARAYGVNEEKILKSVRGQENEARQVVMYLAYEVGWMKLAEIARVMGLGSYGAVAWNCAKVRERKNREPGFKHRLDTLIAELE